MTPLDTEALRAVTERIARAIDLAQAESAEERPRAVVFRVGEAQLSLPLTSVREVALPRPLSRVPRAPEAVLGIMNLRGRVVAVVDLALGLDGEAGEKARGKRRPVAGAGLENGRILLLEHGTREIGLLVDSVEGVAPLHQAPTLLEPRALARTLEALVD